MNEVGIDRQKLEERLHALDVTVKMVGVLQAEEVQRYAPENYAPQSKAAQATVLPPDWSAWFQGWTRILSAADHLFALERALTPGHLLTFSPWTIARSILEATEQVSWLLDPAIDDKQRTARSLGLLRQDAKAQRRIAKAFGNRELLDEDNEVDEYAEILDGIQEVAKEFGVTAEEPTGPSVMGASTDYHLLAGGYHQNQGITEFLSLKKTKSGSNVRYQFNLDEKQIHYLFREPMRWFGIASYRYYSYCGFGVEGLESVCGQAAPVVGLPQRFWER